MLHLGVAVMPDPFRIVRTHLAGSYFLASLSGKDRVLVDGKWLISRPGHAFLRMRRASELLTNRWMKIQSVATAVGYQNPFVFSTTFKRILGWSPSEYPGTESAPNSIDIKGP
jgi:hypothetical protein